MKVRKGRILLADIVTKPAAQREFESLTLSAPHDRTVADKIAQFLNNELVENWEYKGSGCGEPKLKSLIADDVAVQLRRLIQRWQNSGPNLVKMFKRDPELWASCRSVTGKILATETGRAFIHLDQPPLNNRRTPQDEALFFFPELILSPYWEYLGGPCAQCSRHYAKGRRDQDQYCSKRCGSKATSKITI